jgi:hypothetical protein
MLTNISSNAAERKQLDLSLSTRHHHHVPDCESTIFSVIPNIRRALECPSSRERRYVHDSSSFGPDLQRTANPPWFYIGLQRLRFHIVMSTDDLAAAHGIREAVQTEKKSRQILDPISRDISSLNTMTVVERAEYESQHAALGAVLTSRAQRLAGTFPSVCRTGARNPFEMQTSQSADACLLCKMSLQHTISALRLDIGMMAENMSAREASFASRPAHMVVKVLDDKSKIVA